MMSALQNDPVIFAYNLMNEPRAEYYGGTKDVDSWIGEMARFIKASKLHNLPAAPKGGAIVIWFSYPRST